MHSDCILFVVPSSCLDDILSCGVYGTLVLWHVMKCNNIYQAAHSLVSISGAAAAAGVKRRVAGASSSGGVGREERMQQQQQHKS
jgi:hypothetical protein